MVEEHGLVVREEVPKEVVQAGRAAAQELTKIVSSREKKLLLGGKQYLFFEDWQTIGKFYGVTARIESTEELREAISEELIGFIAHAVALHNGEIVSGADAECTRDEPKWAQKPRFQLRSMAQTRACAKALRNCLGWVAVLAGYEATPAEELEGQTEVDRPTPSAPKKRSQEDIDQSQDTLVAEIKKLADGQTIRNAMDKLGYDEVKLSDCDAGKLAEIRDKIKDSMLV